LNFSGIIHAGYPLVTHFMGSIFPNQAYFFVVVSPAWLGKKTVFGNTMLNVR